MSELDDKIRQALAESGIQNDEFEEEDSLRSMIADAYSGKLRWMGFLMTFWQLVFFGLWIWAAVRFFSLPDLDPQILWGSLFLMFGFMGGMIKMMHFMIINRNRLLREIKRLELEVARVGKKVTGR